MIQVKSNGQINGVYDGDQDIITRTYSVEKTVVQANSTSELKTIKVEIPGYTLIMAVHNWLMPKLRFRSLNVNTKDNSVSYGIENISNSALESQGSITALYIRNKMGGG